MAFVKVKEFGNGNGKENVDAAIKQQFFESHSKERSTVEKNKMRVISFDEQSNQCL